MLILKKTLTQLPMTDTILGELQNISNTVLEWRIPDTRKAFGLIFSASMQAHFAKDFHQPY